MAGFTHFELLFAVMAFGISIYAAILSKKSDRKMTAIADSQIDEKLAIMAGYLTDIKSTLGIMKKLRVVWSLNDMRKLNSDFYAIYDLKKYASDKKNEVLIKYYIIPILENLYSIKKGIRKTSIL